MPASETSPLLQPRAPSDAVPSPNHDPGRTDPETGQPHDETFDGKPVRTERGIVAIISVLVLGVLISNSDSSLVLASAQTISSEFNDLADAGWLLTSFTVAMCATQPMYGKLSDIFGKKNMLIVAYILFTVGCAISGVGQSLWQVIIGRVISGLGGSGMTSLVSILIADLVQVRQVARWVSYVNVASTTGRCLGGPVGGWIADTFSWRWSFLGQCPLTLIALLLVVWRLPSLGTDRGRRASLTDPGTKGKLQRIDFLGAGLLACSIVFFLLFLDIGGQRQPWDSPIVVGLGVLSVVLGTLFLFTEAYWAREPIFPLRILANRDVITTYVVLGLQSSAQLGVMFSIPIYFQVTANAPAAVAGAHLIPSVVGNTVGGLLSGFIIPKTGRYKILMMAALVLSSTCYLLLFLTWNGETNTAQSLDVFLGGFGMGVVQSTTFIALQAGIDPTDIAVAGTGLFQSSNVGMVVGLSMTAAIIQISLRRGLDQALSGFKGKEEIIERALSDIFYIQSLTGEIHDTVIKIYVEALSNTHLFSLSCSALAFVASILVKEHKL